MYIFIYSNPQKDRKLCFQDSIDDIYLIFPGGTTAIHIYFEVDIYIYIYG